MEIWAIIIIIIAIVLIVLFAFRPRIEQYWMRGRDDQRQGGGPTDITGDQGTDIGATGSSTIPDAEPERGSDWSSVDEAERELDERDKQKPEGDQLPRL